MTKIETNNAPGAIGPYSQGMIAGKLVFTSGQIPLDPATGAIVGETIEAQSEQALKNLKAGKYKIKSIYGKSKITNTIKIRK